MATESDASVKDALPPAAAPASAAEAGPPRHRWRTVIVVLLALAILFFGVKWFLRSWQTVSTDDAYVNSYATFVAPRVKGQVARVLVEDNNRVKKGDVLVELDPEPFRLQVAVKQAALDAAQADLVVAEATVRGQIGQVRGLRFKLLHAIEDVNNQAALVRARAATWEQSKASLVLASAEFERSKKLVATKVVSAEEFDQRREALDVAQAQVTQALESVYQARTALGLPGQPPAGQSLTDVPADLDQTFSSVREATGGTDARRRAARRGRFFL